MMAERVAILVGSKRLNHGLAGLTVEGFRAKGRALWSLVKVRQAHECWRCGRLIPVNGEAFSPIGNMSYRSRRICVPCIDAILPEAEGDEALTTEAVIKCVICKSVAVTEEDFCYGCKSYLCDEHGQAPWGSHEPDDHHPSCDICGEAHPTDECPNDE